MRVEWPLSETVARRAVMVSTLISLVSGLTLAWSIFSLDYKTLTGALPWFISSLITSSLISFIVFISYAGHIKQVVKEQGPRRVPKELKQAAFIATLPFYIPHIFLLVSGLWFETVGRERLEQRSKRASSEYKQNLLIRKASREPGSKAPPLDQRIR